MKNRLSYIDILKGFGIILVVFGHIYHNDIVVSWIYSFHPEFWHNNYAANAHSRLIPCIF